MSALPTYLPPHPARHALTISDAPEPSDVKYENIEHGTADRAARRLLTSALQYLGLAVGFVLVSMATAMRFNQAAIAGVSRRTCNASCDYKVGALPGTHSERDARRALAEQ